MYCTVYMIQSAERCTIRHVYFYLYINTHNVNCTISCPPGVYCTVYTEGILNGVHGYILVYTVQIYSNKLSTTQLYLIHLFEAFEYITGKIHDGRIKVRSKTGEKHLKKF
jgi:hypothetical protein